MDKINKKDNKQAPTYFGKFSLKSFFRFVGKIGKQKQSEDDLENKFGNKNILAIAGDLGGWHATAVVLARLADRGASIFVIFTGPSSLAFEEKNLEIDARFSVLSDDQSLRDALASKQSPEFSLVIVAPSQSKDGNSETVKVVNEFLKSIPVCVIEDMWGSATPFLKKMRPQVFERTVVCTVDQFAKKMLVESTGIKAKKVFVTGGPQFDRVLELRKKWDEQRTLIRKNIAKDVLVYLVAGGVNGTGEILSLVKGVLRPQDVIIFRQHSRSTLKDKAQTEKEITAIKQAGGKFLEVEKRIAPYTESLLAGSDFVLSGFSTTNRYAILLGITGTIYVGTKSFRKDLWVEKKLKLPPEVEFGAGWYVRNGKEMKEVVDKIAADVLSKRKKEIIKKQKKMAQFCDGRATTRVIAVVSNLI